MVCADGSIYLLDEKEKIKVAHVMEMQQNEIEKWQHYFLQNHIIQPFEQIWELPISFNSVLPGRYEGITLKQNILMGKYSHGIIYHKRVDWSGEGPELEFRNNSLKMDIIEDTEREGYISLGKLDVVRKDRIANHVIHLLDKWTVFGRIAKDDISVMSYMDQYNVSQITEFIEIAIKNKANNLIAALLEYKNNRYPEYDEFTCFEIDTI